MLNHFNGFVFGYKLTREQYEIMYNMIVEDGGDECDILDNTWEINDDTIFFGTELYVNTPDDKNELLDFTTLNMAMRGRHHHTDRFIKVYRKYIHKVNEHILPELYYINITLI